MYSILIIAIVMSLPGIMLIIAMQLSETDYQISRKISQLPPFNLPSNVYDNSPKTEKEKND